MKKHSPHFLLLTMVVFSSSCLAAFKITYPSNADEIKRQKNSTLLLNKATRFMVEVGEGTAAAVPGSAPRVPISDALLLLIPNDWRVYSNGVDLEGVRVDLFANEKWTETLARAGQDYDMIFTVDWNAREVHVKPHVDKGMFDISGLPMSEAEATFAQPKKLLLQAGDLKESLKVFAMLNNMSLETDSYGEDRQYRVHPTVAEYTHPVPECVTWQLPNLYVTVTTEWLKELNRILKPYRLKVFLFANDVIFLTSLHKYGNDFCAGESIDEI